MVGKNVVYQPKGVPSFSYLKFASFSAMVLMEPGVSRKLWKMIKTSTRRALPFKCSCMQRLRFNVEAQSDGGLPGPIMKRLWIKNDTEELN